MCSKTKNFQLLKEQLYEEHPDSKAEVEKHLATIEKTLALADLDEDGNAEFSNRTTVEP